MINTHIKNKRTGVHQDMVSRSFHYKKLLNTKPCIDNSWNGGEPRSFFSNNKMKKTQEMSLDQDNLRLMNKIIKIDRKSKSKSKRNWTEVEQKQRSLKNRYKEYQRQLQISEDNVRMLKKMDRIQSQFSKRNMKQFSKEMGQLALLSRNSIKKVDLMDQVFYKGFKNKLLKGKVEDVRQKVGGKSNQRRLVSQIESIHRSSEPEQIGNSK